MKLVPLGDRVVLKQIVADDDAGETYRYLGVRE